MKHVIIGNGPAGVVAAETLRKVDPASAITLIGDESEPPYSRMAIPYLLTGKIDEAGTYLRKSAGHFAEQRIDLVRDRAEAVDTRAHTVRLVSGRIVPYERLLIATGSRPITPPIHGVGEPGVHPCWTMDDARKIGERMVRGSRALQIGAGFIGCIILEALRSRGVQLSVVEMGDRMVPRMMTPAAGAMIRAWCEKQGVRVRCGTRVTAIRAAGQGKLVASLDSGDELEVETVIVSAGVRPNVEFLQGSGIACDPGVSVDATMRTNIPDVFGAGDVAVAADFSTGSRSVNAIQPNAVEQGRIAALNMAGQRVESQGSLVFNVLDTMGLVSSSFGQWMGVPGGQGAELVDAAGWRYLSLQFNGDVLIGATSIGLTEHVGALRGLVQGRVKLRSWKDKLLAQPLRFPDAYLACAQGKAVRA
jgi:NAD(P)H-nitrite reductase large subunit